MVIHNYYNYFFILDGTLDGRKACKLNNQYYQEGSVDIRNCTEYQCRNTYWISSGYKNPNCSKLLDIEYDVNKYILRAQLL